MDDRPSVIIEGNFARKNSGEEPEEYQAYSFGRVSSKRQVTLLFRKASGEVEGFAYADYRGISAVNETIGFTVRFDTRTVKVEGQHLGELFQYICNHRAAEIREADVETAMQTPEGKAVVWLVKW